MTAHVNDVRAILLAIEQSDDGVSFRYRGKVYPFPKLSLKTSKKKSKKEK